MKIIKKGELGCYASDGDKNMPTNGETFIDTRDDRSYLVTCCRNCGDYSFISLEEAKEFIKFTEKGGKSYVRKRL